MCFRFYKPKYAYLIARNVLFLLTVTLKCTISPLNSLIFSEILVSKNNKFGRGDPIGQE